MKLEASVFFSLGRVLMNCSESVSLSVFLRRFKSNFGITPLVCAVTWNQFHEVPTGAQPVHFLWSLLLLKTYGTESHLRSILNVDEKTLRKWVKIFVRLIADLKVIRWDQRLREGAYRRCYVSVDGTDVPIQEPNPFSSKWWSFKINGPAVRYEIGLCIRTGHIVWVHGWFEAGKYPDVRIFRIGLKKRLMFNEMVVGDRGYTDVKVCRKGHYSGRIAQDIEDILARHETVNKRLKHFNVLKVPFRHSLKFHASCFHAVAVLTQLSIENGSPLFQV